MGNVERSNVDSSARRPDALARDEADSPKRTRGSLSGLVTAWTAVTAPTTALASTSWPPTRRPTTWSPSSATASTAASVASRAPAAVSARGSLVFRASGAPEMEPGDGAGAGRLRGLVHGRRLGRARPAQRPVGLRGALGAVRHSGPAGHRRARQPLLPVRRRAGGGGGAGRALVGKAGRDGHPALFDRVGWSSRLESWLWGGS
jgi:hypothetical protein